MTSRRSSGSMRVESAVEPTRSREHHRDLAAFGSVGARLHSGCKFGCRPGSAGKLTDRREYLSPMPKGDADVFEILIGQIAKYRDINTVLGKGPRVLGHAEFFEPVSNLLHRGVSCPRINSLTELLDPEDRAIRQTVTFLSAFVLGSYRIPSRPPATTDSGRCGRRPDFRISS